MKNFSTEKYGNLGMVGICTTHLSICREMGMSLSKLRELVMDQEAWHAAIHGVTKVRHD